MLIIRCIGNSLEILDLLCFLRDQIWCGWAIFISKWCYFM